MQIVEKLHARAAREKDNRVSLALKARLHFQEYYGTFVKGQTCLGFCRMPFRFKSLTLDFTARGWNQTED